VALLDWIAVALLAVSMLLGLVRGLVFEVMSADRLGGRLRAAAQWLASRRGAWLPIGEPEAAWRYAAGLRAGVHGFGVRRGPCGLALTRKLWTAVGLRPVDRRWARRSAWRAARWRCWRWRWLFICTVERQRLVARIAQRVVLDAALQGLKPALPEKLAVTCPERKKFHVWNRRRCQQRARQPAAL
jgi:membrane protein required for colicin V production